ncbi:ATP-binding cassette domain-containing protein [Spirillospora albida]|uniref:ATP-binding cassette domain-containing protein n=1 Tax=Spirillospora albida TaxID=58123 RepID=UPI0004C15794|nr:ATP-binding cassette domain-containing protein [Spirillospora albida]
MAAAEGLLVAGVTVRFGQVTAVDGVALAAFPGAVTGLVGPPGAGKTTLIDVIAGRRRPAAGAVLLDGAELTGRSAPGVARAGQRPGPFGRATVHEHVRAAADRHARRAPYAGRSARDRRRRRRDARRDTGRRADELLSRVGVAEYAGRRAGNVPAEVARLADVARALAAEPAVLLLDEPWAGLPPYRSRALEVLVRDVAAEGVAVVVTADALEPVMGVCDVVHLLDAGRTVAAGPPAEVRGVTTCRSRDAAGLREAAPSRAPW